MEVNINNIRNKQQIGKENVYKIVIDGSRNMQQLWVAKKNRKQVVEREKEVKDFFFV